MNFTDYKIKDISLADLGRKEIEIAEKEMPGLIAVREKYGPREKIKNPQIRKQYREEYYAIYEKYPQEKATVQDVVDHIDHVVKLVGIDHVGIGSDYDGGVKKPVMPEVSQYVNITRTMMAHGLSEAEIKKIWGGNFLRLLENNIDHRS